MTLQEQIEQAEAQLKEIIANRPKMYRAWQDTWTTFHEDPAAYGEAYDNLYKYDAERNRIADEIKRLKNHAAKTLPRASR
jgi:regulator of RNase E activity RraB